MILAVRLICAFLVLAWNIPAQAKTYVATPFSIDSGSEGSRDYRIDDGIDLPCINRNTDAVTFSLLNFVIKRDAGWFFKDKTATLYLNVTIGGYTKGAKQDPVSIAKTVKADLNDFQPNHPAIITYEDNIIDHLPLTDKSSGSVFDTISVQIALVKEQDQTEATTVLKGLVNAANNISIPANPYMAGFKLASTYVSSVISPLVDAATTAKQSAAFGGQTLKMSFADKSDEATCGNNQRAGSILLVFSDKSEKPQAGAIDIGTPDAYCPIKVVNDQTFYAQVKRRDAAGGCNDASGYMEIVNPYIAFSVTNESILSLSPQIHYAQISERAKILKADSLARCQLWARSPKTC